MLQSRKKFTAEQMAKRFEVSIRTIYRDLRTLEEAGVPIGAEAKSLSTFKRYKGLR